MTRFALIALLAASPVWGQQCRPLGMWDTQLKQAYGESVQGRGIVHDGRRVLLLYANVETGTWTVLVWTPDGEVCGLASGLDFERIDAAPIPMGDDG